MRSTLVTSRIAAILPLLFALPLVNGSVLLKRQGLNDTSPPPTPSPPPTVGSYNYTGCYSEATNVRALSELVYYNENMTVEACAAACAGYVLFGVEYGDECYCGNYLNAGSVPEPETDCNFPCPGNPSELCGAGYRLNVYTLAGQTQQPPSTKMTVGDYTWQGCYSEGNGTRALTGLTYISDSMTVEACANACAGFSFFGVEYGRECYCGDVLEQGSVLEPESDCNFLCPGDGTEYCGAGDRLDLYQN